MYMTFCDINDLVHYVHATRTSTIEKLCGGSTTYLPREISDSDAQPVTCLSCIVTTGRWIRPPFGPDDHRFQAT